MAIKYVTNLNPPRVLPKMLQGRDLTCSSLFLLLTHLLAFMVVLFQRIMLLFLLTLDYEMNATKIHTNPARQSYVSGVDDECQMLGYYLRS